MENTLKKSSLALVIIATAFFHYAYAADNKPKIDCVLTDKMLENKPSAPTDTFTKTTPIIYYVCETGDLHKGQNLKSVWIADDTKNAAPANYKIDEKSIVAEKDLAKGQTYTANFSLSKPTNGWPAGKYHVEVYLDKDLVKSASFTVNN